MKEDLLCHHLKSLSNQEIEFDQKKQAHEDKKQAAK